MNTKININFGMEIFDKFTRPLFVINVVTRDNNTIIMTPNA